MKTYIIHYKKLTERREYLESVLPDVHFIDEFDRNNYQSDIKYQNGLWQERVKWSRTPAYNPQFNKLKHSEICNALSHLKAMQLLLESSDRYALVLEDDSVLGIHL
jgi:GR25 family glycosyltransferase involved in LPS biosynthesis